MHRWILSEPLALWNLDDWDEYFPSPICAKCYVGYVGIFWDILQVTCDTLLGNCLRFFLHRWAEWKWKAWGLRGIRSGKVWRHMKIYCYPKNKYVYLLFEPLKVCSTFCKLIPLLMYFHVFSCLSIFSVTLFETFYCAACLCLSYGGAMELCDLCGMLFYCIFLVCNAIVCITIYLNILYWYHFVIHQPRSSYVTLCYDCMPSIHHNLRCAINSLMYFHDMCWVFFVQMTSKWLHHLPLLACWPACMFRSNTIDALLFVFGKRAKKMRLNKVAILRLCAVFPDGLHANLTMQSSKKLCVFMILGVISC